MSYGGTNEAWIVGAVRTPIGRHGGALSAVRPDDLGAVALEALADRSGVPPSEVEDVYFGCANQAGEDNRNVARMSLLLAGFPEEVAGVTVNRLCGSGLEAVAQAARAVMLGEAGVYVGGGRVHEPRPMGRTEAGARLPHGQHHHVRHHIGMALRQPQDAGDGPYRLSWYDRREPRSGEVPSHAGRRCPRRGGRRLRRLARGPGPLRPPQPREGRCCDGRSAFEMRSSR